MNSTLKSGCSDDELARAEPMIELKGVSKAFGSNVVLDNVDLTIHRGDALAIIGPSGTGKSTILRLISGLLAPDQGEIYVQGQLRHGLVEDAKDPLRISLVFQNAALFDSLTVEENVGFMLYQNSQLSRKRIRELVDKKLEMVGLPGIGGRYPAELSGGMRKRVSFARAIMDDPDDPSDDIGLILYDEPTAGLDPIASTVIEDLIRELRASQGGCGTYTIITHQHSTIRRTANRIVFLYHGKVQWEGSADDVDTTDSPIMKQFFSGSLDGPIHVTEAPPT